MIIDHLEKCGLLSDFQYGFKSSWSTGNLLTVVSDRIARVFNRSGATWAVALDISKAFDRGWHYGLLHKFRSYGTSGQIFHLISSFLKIGSFKWFWMESLHKNIQLMLKFLKAPFLVLHFSYYTLMTFLTMLSAILLSMLIIILSVLSVIRHLICGNNLNRLNLNLIYETLWTGVRSGSVYFNVGKTQLDLFDRYNNGGSLDVKMDGSILEEKSSFKMLGLTFSFKLDWGSYIISTAKTASRKIGVLIHSMKFLSPEVALYLYKSTIHSHMEYCYHFWAGAPSCYLKLLDKLQKRICRTVGTSSMSKCGQLKSLL